MGNTDQPVPDRRLQGRVPFVRRCALVIGGGRQASALLVNINTTGAYIAHGDLTRTPATDEAALLGEVVACRFGLPDRDDELAVQGVVTWVNARQPHPVHSLPPGFGLTFQGLSPQVVAEIERIMADASGRATL